MVCRSIILKAVKTLIALFLCIETSMLFASDFDIYKKSQKHYQSKDYYTALHLIASLYKYKTPDQNIQHYIEKLVAHTGTYYFNTYNDIELRKMNIPTTDLLMAKRNLYLKKYPFALKRLKKFPEGHRLYPEALLVKATTYYQQKNFSKAIEVYNSCYEAAAEKLSKEDDKVYEYYFVLKDTCQSNIARIHFEKQDYQKAIDSYEKVSKRSFKWPYLLREKAWSYYYLGQYNRSLGMLMTYQSPLLKSYFLPEVEYLKALNYFKLCRYNEAVVVMDNFFKEYQPKSEKLRKVIRSKDSKAMAYFDMMFTPIVDTEKDHHFLRNAITQITKRVKYQLDIKSFYALNEEIYRGNKSANLSLLLELQKDLKEQINHYTRVSIYQFINEIHRTAELMLNLKLEALSRQRTMAYSSQRNKHKKKIESNNIPTQDVSFPSNQNFWQFYKEFWADELGEYVFTLKSECKRKG